MTPWVELAKSAELNDNIEHSVLQFAHKAYESSDKALMRQATLRLRLARLDSFLKAGTALADRLRTYLAEGHGDGMRTVDNGEETNTAGLRSADEDQGEDDDQGEDENHDEAEGE
jgi:hypothetical protein